MNAQPRLPSHIAEHGEIDMGGEVHLARIGEGIGEPVRLHRLKRVAQRRPFIAIIDDDRRAALPRDLLRQGIGDFRGCDRRFQDRTVGRIRRNRRQARFDAAIACDRDEAARLFARQQHPLAPFVAHPDALADGQRVEKFIGDNQQRPLIGQAGDRVMVDRGGQQRLLPAAQRWTGFHQMHWRRQGGALHRAQGIGRQRAASGAEFDIGGLPASARPHPDVGQRQPDKLPEHLADFRRGREIALRAQGIASGVIMLVCLGNIMGDRNRSARGDLPRQPVGQRQRIRRHWRFLRPVRRAGAGPWRSG